MHHEEIENDYEQVKARFATGTKGRIRSSWSPLFLYELAEKAGDDLAAAYGPAFALPSIHIHASLTDLLRRIETENDVSYIVDDASTCSPPDGHLWLGPDRLGQSALKLSPYQSFAKSAATSLTVSSTPVAAFTATTVTCPATHTAGCTIRVKVSTQFAMTGYKTLSPPVVMPITAVDAHA